MKSPHLRRSLKTSPRHFGMLLVVCSVEFCSILSVTYPVAVANFGFDTAENGPRQGRAVGCGGRGRGKTGKPTESAGTATRWSSCSSPPSRAVSCLHAGLLWAIWSYLERKTLQNIAKMLPKCCQNVAKMAYTFKHITSILSRAIKVLRREVDISEPAR